MTTELVKVDPKEFGLEETQVAVMAQAFPEMHKIQETFFLAAEKFIYKQKEAEKKAANV